MQYESEEKEKDASDRVTESEDDRCGSDVFFDPRASVLEVKCKFLCWAHGLQVMVVQETL